MAKYKDEITELHGPDATTKWKVLFLVGLQTFLACSLADAPWWKVIAMAYLVGGIASHALTLAIHEISHNLAFDSLWANRALGYVGNFPLVFPYSVTFKRYHMEHHRLQGDDTYDADIPTYTEARILSNPVGKIFFLIFQVLFYALRPTLVSPKSLTKPELLNYVTQISYVAAMLYFNGPGAIVYLLVCMLLGLGLHPIAGHFIAEHYVFVPGWETYSYYGPVNWAIFNVGYHNEHHDMPRIPGSRLYRLREIAPEFYEHLPYHTSYIRVLWDFLTRDDLQLWSRVRRSTKKGVKEE